MTQSQYLREQLAAKHDLRNFRSGVTELDLWLHESALKTGDRDYGRTYVWHNGDDQVVAFYTLSAHVITLEKLPKKYARGQQKIIPAILLGKFALDESLQGQGLGEVLLADAVVEALKASDIAAARYLVVDALSERLVTFYEKYGFIRGVSSDVERIPLFAKMKDLRRGLNY